MMQAEIELTKAGVETELHIWDGMWHSFFSNPDLPETKGGREILRPASGDAPDAPSFQNTLDAQS